METGDILRKAYDAIFHRPTNFSFVDDYVCGSGRIMSKRDVDWLRKKGVKSILCLTETPIEQAWLGNTGIKYFHEPMRNHGAPATEQLERCVGIIEGEVAAGNKTLVHCAAGKGRTGTVIAAYFCKHDGVLPEEAIEKIRKKRPGSVERDPKRGQERAVIEFGRGLTQ